MIAPQNVNVLYTGGKSYITSLTGIREGAIAYATDTDEFGTYNGTSWTWGTGISDVPVDGITYGRANQTWVDLDTIYMQSDGWTPVTDAWTYASADAPVYQVYVAGDVTTSPYYQAGYKVRFVQSATIKYGIIVKVGSYDGGNNRTPVDIYCGTDYSIANAAISNTNISIVKSPQGFPTDPTKWTVTVTDTTQRSQASPVATTWYNLGSISVSIPIGVWRVSYSVLAAGVLNAGGQISVFTTLSTANNSESDSSMTRKINAASLTQNEASLYALRLLSLTTKTSYYINTKSNQSIDTLYNQNAQQTLTIKLECAYL